MWPGISLARNVKLSDKVKNKQKNKNLKERIMVGMESFFVLGGLTARLDYVPLALTNIANSHN